MSEAPVYSLSVAIDSEIAADAKAKVADYRQSIDSPRQRNMPFLDIQYYEELHQFFSRVLDEQTTRYWSAIEQLLEIIKLWLKNSECQFSNKAIIKKLINYLESIPMEEDRDAFQAWLYKKELSYYVSPAYRSLHYLSDELYIALLLKAQLFASSRNAFQRPEVHPIFAQQGGAYFQNIDHDFSAKINSLCEKIEQRSCPDTAFLDLLATMTTEMDAFSEHLLMDEDKKRIVSECIASMKKVISESLTTLNGGKQHVRW